MIYHEAYNEYEKYFQHAYKNKQRGTIIHIYLILRNLRTTYLTAHNRVNVIEVAIYLSYSNKHQGKNCMAGERPEKDRYHYIINCMPYQRMVSITESLSILHVCKISSFHIT